MFGLIERNVREPKIVSGDLMAQMSSILIAERQLRQFCELYRLDGIDAIAFRSCDAQLDQERIFGTRSGTAKRH